MQSFSMLFRLEKTLLKNNILTIIKSPKRMITYVLYFVLMTWVVFSNSKNFGNASTNPDSFYNYASGGVFIMLFMLGFGLTKKSSIYFKMCDINLLFTAPVDPRKLLMFTLLKRIPVYLLTSLYTLIFLVSMVIGLFQPSTIELMVTCFGYTMVFLVLEPLGFCIFAIATKLQNSEINQKYMKMLFAGIGVFALYQVYLSVNTNGFSIQSVMGGLGSDDLNWLPIIGWGKQLTLTSLTGVSTMTYVYLGLMIVLYFTLVILTYILGDDYFEDVIQSSEEKNILIKKARSGRLHFNGIHFKNKKIKTNDTQKYAGAIYWKRKLITMKTDLSVFFSMESVLCLILGIGSAYFIEGDSAPFGAVIVTGIYFYMKFLLSTNTSLDQELKMHYYYTLPDTAIHKMIAVTKLDVIRFFINISVLVAANAVFSQHISGLMVLLPVAAAMFYVMMLLSSFLLKLFFTAEDYNRLMVMFKMLQMLLVLMPAFITMLVIAILTESTFYALLGSLVVNILLTTIILGLSDVIFNRLELK